MFNLLSGGSGLGGTIFLIVALVGIVGLFIWQSISGKKKQQEAQNMVNALKVGDRVKTIGGICGFVVEINNAENTFVLETGTDDKKSYVKFDKGAIYQTAPKEGSAVAAKEEPKEIATEEPQEVFEEVVAEAPKSNKKTAVKKTAKKDVADEPTTLEIKEESVVEEVVSQEGEEKPQE